MWNHSPPNPRGLAGLRLRRLGRFELRGGGRPLRVSPSGERLPLSPHFRNLVASFLGRPLDEAAS
jgi:hypothetical protein